MLISGEERLAPASRIEPEPVDKQNERRYETQRIEKEPETLKGPIPVFFTALI